MVETWVIEYQDRYPTCWLVDVNKSTAIGVTFDFSRAMRFASEHEAKLEMIRLSLDDYDWLAVKRVVAE